MKAVILAGGLGVRLSEETGARPKPMVEIGGRPILWHIMKSYAVHGITDFIVCCGYKGFVIKEYFANYGLHMSDITFDMALDAVQVHKRSAEPWKITLVDTGTETMTGGRIKRVASHLTKDDFCLTYGDGVSDVNISELILFHKAHMCEATITAVQPPGRFGVLNLNGDRVLNFTEKPEGDGNWINGGFFVLSPKVLKYIQSDETIWEKEPVNSLAAADQLRVFKHHGFWQPMDTLRDKTYLEKLWNSGNAPWKTWKD
jgi:glucose-1-phosphate cytidylyltransferase